MANKGYVSSLLNSLGTDLKRIFDLVFIEVMDHAELGGSNKATNFNWYKVSSTTHATANTEFSFTHGLPSTPKWLIPVVDLSASGSQLVPLTVSKAADGKRVYLKSASTGAVFTCYLE